MAVTDEAQNRLRAFYDRRHPRYDQMWAHWRFLEAAYQGGREWFSSNIFKYHKEGPEEFNKRLERAYRFNHTREVVDLVQKYLFKAKIERKDDSEVEEVVKEFWKRATLSGLSIDQLMKSSSTKNSIGGRVAIVIDNNMLPRVDEKGKPIKMSVAEAKRQNSRIYGYLVPAEDILD